jgi:hypothetical protein
MLTEQMAGTAYGVGVRLWIPVNADGIAYVPGALAGGTLVMERGSNSVVIEKWDGQSLDLKFENR